MTYATRKSQASLEYMVILAFTLLILLPAFYIFYSFTSQSNQQIADAQIDTIGTSIIENAQFVHYAGESSKVTLDLDLPTNVQNISIVANRELVFKILSEEGEKNLVFFSDVVPLSCANYVCTIATEDDAGKIKLRVQSIEELDSSRSVSLQLETES